MINRIREFFYSYPSVLDRIRPVLRKIGYAEPLWKHINSQIENIKDFTFIQIGANDGITNDPFRDFFIRKNAKGILVEPIHSLFSALKKNYTKYSNLIPVNCAISYVSSDLVLYTLGEDFLANCGNRRYLETLASFDKNILCSFVSGNDNAIKNIQQIKVPCKTVEELMNEYQFSSFDCMFLDIEGYEEQVLKNVDFKITNTKFIVYENHLLVEKGRSLELFLQSKGFQTVVYDEDTVAILNT